MSLNTTFVAGTTVITAAHLNGIQAAWTSYTPTWSSAGTAPAIGNGTLTGKWIQIGKTIRYRINLTMGSTTTYGSANNWIFTLPIAAHADYTANMHLGNGIGLDASVPAYSTLTAGWLSSTTIFILSGTGSTALQQTQPWTWAVSDKVSIHGFYEAA